MASERDQIEYIYSGLGWRRGEIEYRFFILYVYEANSDWPLGEIKLSIYTQVRVRGEVKLSIYTRVRVGGEVKLSIFKLLIYVYKANSD